MHRKNMRKMLVGILAAGLLLSSAPSVAYAVEGEEGGVFAGQEADSEEIGAETGQEAEETEPKEDGADTGEPEESADMEEAPDAEGDVSGAVEPGEGSAESGPEEARGGALPEQAETAAAETFAAEGSETSGSCGESVTWRFEDGVLTISGSGEMKDYSRYDYGGFASWYGYRDKIHKVIICDGVTSIGKYAFQNCSLTSIIIPESVASIGYCAFAGCGSLTDVFYLSSIEGWCNIEFKYSDRISMATSKTAACNPLHSGADLYVNGNLVKDLIIPDGVTGIGNCAFSGCGSLTSITISDSVTSIGEWAFYNCRNVTSVAIPGSVTSINYGTFENCSSLTSVAIPGSVTSIGLDAFHECSSLMNITIPDGVTSIGQDAFSYCSSLTSIAIPASVTSIGLDAFDGCSNLKEVYILSIESWCNIEFGHSGLLKNGADLYVNGSLVKDLIIPDSVTVIRKCAFEYWGSLMSVTIPDSVTSIGKDAFEYCSSLTSITIPDSVTSIGELAFEGCSSLTSATISDSVTSISDRAFSACSGLTSIAIPASVTSIGGHAFSHCSGLTSIAIPASVTSIGEWAFSGCSNLTDVYYGGSEDDWNAIRKGYDDVLRSANIHYNSLSGSAGNNLGWILDMNGVLTIRGKGNMADYHDPDSPAPWSGKRDQIKTVIISQGVTSIGASAFFGCTNLTEITIPKSVVSIGDSAFNGCENLAHVRYLGTKEQFDSIVVGNDNVPFQKASHSWIQPGTEPDTNVQVLEDVYYYDTIAGTGVKTDLTWDWDYLNWTPSTYNCSLAEMGVVLSATIEHSSSELSDILMAKNFDKTNSLGCDDLQFDATSSPGVAFAHKTVNDASGKTGHVIFVVIRGTTRPIVDGANDILSAMGWGDWGSADAYSALQEYLKKCGKKYGDVNRKNTKFFVTGHSLGGACANIVAKKLSDEYGTSNVHAYTFAAPSPFGNEVTNNYTNIHNFLCWDDNVPTRLSMQYPWYGYGYYTWFYQNESPETEAGYQKLTGKRWQETYDKHAILRLHAPSIYLAFLQTHPDFEPRKGKFHVCYMRAKCPVDIEIFNSANELVGRIINDEVDFESQTTGVMLTVTEGLKSVYFAKDDTYTVRITGTGEGTMIFTAASADLNSGIVEEEKIFSNVQIVDGKKMVSRVDLYDETNTEDAVKISDVELLVTNENGDRIARVLSDQEAASQGKDKGTEVSLDQADEVLPEDIPADGKIPEGLWIAGVKDSYTYTGTAIKPEIRVYDGKTRLQPGKDYTASYKNNIKVSNEAQSFTAPTITVKGKGNYAGTETATFQITAVDLSDSVVLTEDVTVAYNKKIQKKVPIVTYNGKKLSANRDFTVSYPNGGDGAYKEVGVYDILLTAKSGGNFSGTRTVKCTITDNTLLSKVSVKKIPAKVYTGEAIEPELTVSFKGAPLVKDTDYSVSFSDNTEIGTAKAILTGIGKYAGTKNVSFNITGTSLKGASVSGIENKIYNGCDQKQTFTLTLKGKVLVEGTDYDVLYEKNKNVGKAGVTIKGKGAYTGTIRKTFTVEKFNIAANADGRFEVKLEQDAVPYAKGGAKPGVTVRFKTGDEKWNTLAEGNDYILSYRNHTAVNDGSNQNKQPVVTVNGKGSFSGTYGTSLTYKIVAQDMGQLKLTAQDKTYQNKKNVYVTKITITDLDGKTLKAGTDYNRVLTYSYANETTVNTAGNGTIIRAAGALVDKNDMIPAGTILKVQAEAKSGGNYTGTLTGEYRMTQAAISSASVSVPKQIYTGRAITLEKKQITVRIKGKQLDESQYEIVPDSYKNNVKKGTATVKIRGLDNYGGAKDVKFTIKAKGFLWWWR